jgi:mannose-6-phosphate isomerase-like protein (cupin superfamily)
MIRRKTEMTREVRERMREGTGEVEILHLFKKGELRGKTRLFARLILAKGCSIGHHVHEGEEEVFYILRGRAIVKEDGAVSEVGPGDAVLTGGGSGHSIENGGDEPVEILAVILTY